MDVNKWITAHEAAVEGGVECSGFWQGLSIWIDRPHILNKRISAINATETISFKGPIDLGWKQIAQKITAMDTFSGDSLIDKLGASICTVNEEPEFVVQFRNCFPRQISKFPVLEILIKDFRNNVAVFVPKYSNDEESVNLNGSLLIPKQTYAIEFIKNSTLESTSTLRLLIYNLVDGVENLPDVEWLRNKIFPKVLQWIRESLQQLQKNNLKFPSLKLISTQRYCELYQQLKQKYGPKLVEIWPERTDPHKFVYEDISIATYLLILWELQRQNTNNSQLQSFVDLGCGNGLLVHILCSEGHPGIGIDIKRRKIWDYFGPETTLKEVAFTPSTSHLFPNYDWIIGNHSDELTPWIPVIAARSSPTTSFFLLPCCAHNFDSKFQRRDTKLSQYEDYIGFVRDVVRVCGFQDEIDKLRIPSTKRICIIGQQRVYKANDWPEVDLRIKQFIMNQCARRDNGANEGATWAENFNPRSTVQLPRNCTTLEQNIKDSIVKTVFNELLRISEKTQLVPVANHNPKIWHVGGDLELSQVAKIVKSEHLSKLKSEFGGLQTLLRNHHHIFKVINGKVQLRNYLTSAPTPKKTTKQGSQNTPNTKWKTKPCWFNLNHPDGCLLESCKCPFAHSTDPQSQNRNDSSNSID